MIDELQDLFDLTFRKSKIVDYEIKKKEIPYLVKDIFKELSCWLAVAAVGTGCIFGLRKCANAEYDAQNSPEFVKKLQELDLSRLDKFAKIIGGNVVDILSYKPKRKKKDVND